MTDVERIIKIQEEKGPLQQLTQRGAISHEVFETLLSAELELEHEITEVLLFSKMI
jgi:translocation protein SEC66